MNNIPKPLTTIAKFIFPLCLSAIFFKDFTEFQTMLLTILACISFFPALGTEELIELGQWCHTVWNRTPLFIINSLKWIMYLSGLVIACLAIYVMTLHYVQHSLLNFPIQGFYFKMTGWGFIGLLSFITFIHIGNKITVSPNYSRSHIA